MIKYIKSHSIFGKCQKEHTRPIFYWLSICWMSQDELFQDNSWSTWFVHFIFKLFCSFAFVLAPQPVLFSISDLSRGLSESVLYFTITNLCGALNVLKYSLDQRAFWIVTMCSVQHFLGCNLHTRPLLEISWGKIWNSKVFLWYLLTFWTALCLFKAFYDLSYTLKQFDKINQKF